MASRRQCLTTAAASACGLALQPARAATTTSPAQAAMPPAVQDEIWVDASRQRAVPVRIRWPGESQAAPEGGRPVVMFSHGLGGTRAGGEVWGQAWALAGFVVVHLQHPGSDLDAVRQNARDFTDRAGLQRLIGPAQLLARAQDVGFALDELGQRHAARKGSWTGVRPTGVGLAGHSQGAHTTMAVAGQRYPAHPGFAEPRLAAFIAFSPTLPVVGNPVEVYNRVTRPVLCLTGTLDSDVVGVGATPERRIGVFPALPAGHKAQLVLADADHMSFAGQTGRAVEIVPRQAITRELQARHHALIASITTDWWLAQLLGDTAAKARLMRPEGLASGDIWRTG